MPLRKGPGAATFGQEPMRVRIGTGDVAVGGRSRCVRQQEPLLQPAGAASPDGRRRCCCGHRRRCCGWQEPPRMVVGTLLWVAEQKVWHWRWWKTRTRRG